MYKDITLKTVVLPIMLLPLVGCSLAMNQAPKDKPISVSSAHWLNDENSAAAWSPATRAAPRTDYNCLPWQH